MTEVKNVRYPLLTIIHKQDESQDSFWFDVFGMCGFFSMMLVMFIFAGIFS